jgi:hypothetical protein
MIGSVKIGTDKDYPQAFPIATATNISLGMTMRDYFAGQIIIGLIRTDVRPDILQRINTIGYVGVAYELADEMLTEREKP